ncbi:hypothetical protein SERLA73DRAFT_185663 [Serpula lacrymans var. lacrymans S7.3]|uniref:AB hydrolase-1 domain-containing protein n=2 Tax=Serpula lacrymans var. lacrymans TaxID=341189 RepID=F8Q673_SERL3|nr:uncharacterized protein SERLADRAFT_474262 [Serpula lacrymans var. lacrymans S7.9]EGN96111.1 hypothetical protein SERLA73DRAFT_185663 [Serpula lacrymans var. lacrymans S7.3]EGO21631.1 hypothetical protein SERLADRAFT_474262 [Serpula lacrymans var. lacrymans S7.9]
MSQPTPELNTLFDPLTCTRKGLCPVTQIRNKGDPLESHSLYFEQHGTGPEKILFIMGLNGTLFAWGSQIDHFGHSDKYTALAFDNRGVGHSGSPMGPYTTSGMAEDAITLLNYVGWTDKHSLHVVGISLGGMIAQELSTRIPERIISLSLVVTKAGGRIWNNFPSLSNGIKMFRTWVMTPEAKAALLVDLLFPQEWLDEKALNDSSGRTNRDVQFAAWKRRDNTIPRQTAIGSLSQMSAAYTHHCSDERLRTLSSTIPKVAIIGADQDKLVDSHNSIYLKKQMPEAELIMFEKTGHAISGQDVPRFNRTLERIFEEGREKIGRAENRSH